MTGLPVGSVGRSNCYTRFPRKKNQPKRIFSTNQTLSGLEKPDICLCDQRKRSPSFHGETTQFHIKKHVSKIIFPGAVPTLKTVCNANHRLRRLKEKFDSRNTTYSLRRPNLINFGSIISTRNEKLDEVLLTFLVSQDQ